MEIRYEKHWSGHLNREMEFKVYGHSEASWEKQIPIFMECLGL